MNDRDEARAPGDSGGAPAPDPRNTLNDLTGREWTYALRSVISTRYPTSGPEAYAHALRRAHPSPKPPQLMAELIRFFTKAGGRVLDPFAGVGGTLLACALEDREGVGVELAAEYAAIYAQAADALGLARQQLVVGDARRLAEYPAVAAAPFDLILTDPPYAQMMARPKTGERKKQGRADATPFTADPADLGNLGYREFLAALRDVLAGALAHLKPRGYLVLFTKDMQPTREHHNMLHADIVAELAQLPGLTFRGYRIWHDQGQNLYPFGYPFAFVSNQVHQFILVFRKEPPAS
ncbi:TRM11 family SAM-dependent methyltransferase [Kouleothrix sp.]|uniref:TRM11 family SAM-dependent methyltransferase n=1 Tax=Kouleothrix sp. TaxID=2779161 RepID=UPI0039194A5D